MLRSPLFVECTLEPVERQRGIRLLLYCLKIFLQRLPGAGAKFVDLRFYLRDRLIIFCIYS